MTDTFPERILNIISKANRPIHIEYIDFMLALEKFNKLSDEDKLDFRNEINNSDVADAIRTLLIQEKILETTDRSFCLSEWNEV